MLLPITRSVAPAKHGASVVWISNHGGRQLDGTVSPIRVLPEVVDAVGRQVVVMMDSGVRRGTDVLKALALGAKFVWVGRPMNFAASVAGEAGGGRARQSQRGAGGRPRARRGGARLDQLGPEYLKTIIGV